MCVCVCLCLLKAPDFKLSDGTLVKEMSPVRTHHQWEKVFMHAAAF